MPTDNNPEIGPDERPPVLRIEITSDENVFDELRSREPETGVRTLSFGGVGDFRSLLTDRRVELIKSLMDEPASSISELANRLDRDYRTVYDDIEVLREYDVVYFGEGKGRGKRPFIPYESIEIGGTIAKTGPA